MTETHFFRSNTDTRFPTGLITAFPSLEKLRFPWRYTAPSRLENCKTQSFLLQLSTELHAQSGEVCTAHCHESVTAPHRQARSKRLKSSP